MRNSKRYDLRYNVKNSIVVVWKNQTFKVYPTILIDLIEIHESSTNVRNWTWHAAI